MNLGKGSFSKTDRVKYEMTYGFDTKTAWRLVTAYWPSFKAVQQGRQTLLSNHDLFIHAAGKVNV